MATKIYFPSSGSAPVTPSTWNFPNQINPLTFAGLIAKINSTMTTKLEATGTTSPIYRAMLRYVIGPLSAVEISGTIRLQMRALESNALANATLCIAVKIIKPDGTDRSVLLAYTASDSATSPYEILSTALTNRRAYNASEVQPITLTPQTPTAGDYLVIEIGFRSATTTTRNISLRYGDTNVADMEDNTTSVNDYAPYVEFSQTLSFIMTRNLISAIAGVSSLPDITIQTIRELAANISAGSTVPDISMITARDIQVLIAGVSSTPDVMPPFFDMTVGFWHQNFWCAKFWHEDFWGDAATAETRNLIATILVSSTTPDAIATIARALQALIVAQSITPYAAAVMARALIASIAVSSSTPDVAAITIRALLAAIAAGSLTPDVAATITRSILTNINPSSLTPDVSIIIARALISSIAAGSYTPDITITIQGVISLIANITGSSLTPDVASTVARALIASIPAQSATADVIASITRNMIANVIAGSLTPDITATYFISLAAAIAGVSITPDITASMARSLSAIISGQSVTLDVQATIARDLLAVIHGTSVTPDDLILILGMYTIRERIMENIQTRFGAITPSGLDSIRQQIVDAVNTRFKTMYLISLATEIRGISTTPDITASIL